GSPFSTGSFAATCREGQPRHGTSPFDWRTGHLGSPKSTVIAIEARHYTSSLAINTALFQIRPFITGHFALGNTELDCELAVFPVKLENNQRPSGDLRFAIKLVDLLSM